MASIYDYSVPSVKDGDIPLSNYKGKVMLIVNTATGCGFTPQYKQLEEMYEKYHEKGLEIIDIPCNQFAGQAPQDDQGIHEFCTLKYNTKFPQMKKSAVNGEHELPVYTFLKKEQKFQGMGKGLKAKMVMSAYKHKGKVSDNPDDIHWNFTKFVVDKDGNVVRRFEPTEDMKDLDSFIASLL